ncbi:MAG: hypothetical protein M1839_002985 [Geoglossum umbratile]|nr:MAG: hypothetical protein M1839_002985 [Geoglossum umbratile]
MADTPAVPKTRQPSLNASIKRVVLPALINLISLQSTVWGLPQKRQEEIAWGVNDAFTEREQTTLLVVYCRFGHEDDHEGTFQEFALTWLRGSKIFEEASQSFSAFRGSMLNKASVTGKEVGKLWKDILEKTPSLIQQFLCLSKLQWMDKPCLSPDGTLPPNTPRDPCQFEQTADVPPFHNGGECPNSCLPGASYPASWLRKAFQRVVSRKMGGGWEIRSGDGGYRNTT